MFLRDETWCPYLTTDNGLQCSLIYSLFVNLTLSDHTRPQIPVHQACQVVSIALFEMASVTGLLEGISDGLSDSEGAAQAAENEARTNARTSLNNADILYQRSGVIYSLPYFISLNSGTKIKICFVEIDNDVMTHN